MKCEDIREQLLDVAAGRATPELSTHLGACPRCAAAAESLRRTMALLDEWQAPEPSPYFGQRLGARIREEAAAQPQGLLGWLRSPAFLRPVAAAAFALVLAAGIGLYQYSDASGRIDPGNAKVVEPVPPRAPEGSAVADLQALENQELLAEFDLLDELAANGHDTSAVDQ